MSNSPQRQQLDQAQAMTARLSKQGYDIAVPGIQSEYSDLNAALSEGGEFQFQKDAYSKARGGILEGAAGAERGAQADRARSGEQAARGGNFAASLNPADAGQKLAMALYGTRTSEAMGAIEETDKLTGLALGQSQQTGSAAMQATGNELQNIGFMKPYNSTYANVLGALNTAGTVYGAGKQAGWFGGAGSDVSPGFNLGTNA